MLSITFVLGKRNLEPKLILAHKIHGSKVELLDCLIIVFADRERGGAVSCGISFLCPRFT